MGRIGQSLIMLGQPLYCSLFGVCWAGDGLRLLVRVLVCTWTRACVGMSMRCVRWDKAMARKKDPTLSHPPTPPPPHVYASPNWILYYRSSQVWTTHFPLLLFCLFFLSFPSLTPFSFLTLMLHSSSVFLFLHVLDFTPPFPYPPLLPPPPSAVNIRLSFPFESSGRW